VRIVVVDHQDSFTWNLVHAFGELGACEPRVVGHRGFSAAALRLDPPDLLGRAPGPAPPSARAGAGATLDELLRLPPQLPCFGVCLGLQLIAAAAGAAVVAAPEPVHGHAVAIVHDGHALFDGIATGEPMMRYHSLVVDAATLRAPLQVIARSPRNEVMALAASDRPTWAVQFHPESIGSPAGTRLIANVIELARRAPRNP